MKRLWIALGLLCVVLAGTLAHSFRIHTFTQDLIAILEQAEVRADEKNWEAAGELNHLAHQKWDQRSTYLHILHRHNETDQIYTGFHETAELIQNQEAGEYAAANARLISHLELLAEAEQLNLKNVL